MYFNLIRNCFEYNIFPLNYTIQGVLDIILSYNNQYNIQVYIFMISFILIQTSLRYKDKHTGEKPIIFMLYHIMFLYRSRSIYLEIKISGDIHPYDIYFKKILRKESNLSELHNHKSDVGEIRA